MDYEFEESEVEEIFPFLYIWHFDMLHDEERNVAYRKSIEYYINVNRERTIRCLDIGTGSGLLGLIAVKEGATFCTAFEGKL